MSTFRRISESISGFLWVGKTRTSPQQSTTSTQPDSFSPSSSRNPNLPRRMPLDSPLYYESFSAVDDLIARSLSYELENLESLSNIIQSIEIPELDVTETQDGANDVVDDDKPRDRKNLLEQPHEVVDIRGKYRQQLEDASRLSELGWNHDTILIYLKIARRGYEPLFPPSWRHDFPKFPPILFAKNEESAFIKPIVKSNFMVSSKRSSFIPVLLSLTRSLGH
jgi:hypothetical protein